LARLDAACSYGTAGTIRFDLVTVFGNTFNTVAPVSLDFQKVENNLALTWSNPPFALQAPPAVTGISATRPQGTPRRS